MNAPSSSEAAQSSTPQTGADADGALIAAVYDELHALASAYLRKERQDHTLQTTALVNEAWLRLSGRDGSAYSNRAHFFRAAALAMRRILIDHATRRTAEKRGGLRSRLVLDEKIDQQATHPGQTPDGADLLALDAALRQLAAENAQMARVVELRYFGGCTIDETAEALGISTSTVERDWRFARAWLRAAIGGDEISHHS
ncbi:MAG: ECF-type sigma factor [Phycisphaerae bacterium]|nr:ECF-type sigma factor [Phycisphaerae bacterium]